jgi:AraC-like DNA-binding protein
MRKNLDCLVPGTAGPVATTDRTPAERVAAPERAAQMREQLAAFVARGAAGTLAVRVPEAPADGVARGDGHFHLAAELFLQVAGWTEFRFPHTTLRLRAGEALLLPPRLLHAERVGGGSAAAPFCNIVIYADGAALSCHLAHEAAPGRPDILHLETTRHAQALHVHDWLGDAARLGRTGDAAGPMAEVQARSLVAAAAAGVLRALDAADPQAPPEPALVARARVLVNNQLGDPHLSVRSLAAQAGCTADYLSHRFSQATGEHLAAYIVRQRMERAAHLLEQSALAGKEVAWACGFATPSYFVRSFRSHHGLTPQAWRAARGLPLAPLG